MIEHISAQNCSTVLNTIFTTYLENAREEIINSIGKHELDKSNIKLLYVGAVEERKKILELIELLQKIPTKARHYHLTIIGDGDHLAACKLFVKSNNINNITFAGRIYELNELKPYYLTADLFVMPGDGGLAIAQSLLFGLPAICIATDGTDGTERDYIDDKNYILNDFDKLPRFLENFPQHYDRKTVLPAFDRLLDNKFISAIKQTLEIY